MGFRTVGKFKRFETEEPVETIEDAFNGALGGIEGEGLNNVNEEPCTTIVMTNNVLGGDGQRKTNCIVYIGATMQEIAEDLNSRS
jgi:hypothetical protein